MSKHNLSGWGLGGTRPYPGQGVPHPYPGQGGTPLPWPGGYPILARGTCLELMYPQKGLGPDTGVPLGKDMGPVEVIWDGIGYPPSKDMGPVEVLWDVNGVPYVVNRQTKWKYNLPSYFLQGR